MSPARRSTSSSTEPATQNPLFGRSNVVCTPHLGASTTEAQEKVALQVAEQMSDYLTRGAVTNAVNFPSISAEEAPRLRPYVELAEKLGLFVGQIASAGVDKISLIYEGGVAEQKTKAITASALSGLLKPILQTVNPVCAAALAKERGVVVEEVTREAEGDYESLVTLRAATAQGEITVAGTVFHDGKPRIVRVADIAVEAEFTPSMIFVSNEDKPGFIGRFAGLLGDAAAQHRDLRAGSRPPRRLGDGDRRRRRRRSRTERSRRSASSMASSARRR